ncbi:hypothetical protein FACS1894122_14190 [Alphaproteobacteria bacterium]|nr:hypothetical protein FACS1894122_14190 [Alphaproteobacteria bacterium]
MNYLISGLLICASLSDASAMELINSSQSSTTLRKSVVNAPQSQSSIDLRSTEGGNADTSQLLNTQTLKTNGEDNVAVDTDDVFINRLLRMEFFQKDPQMAMMLQTYKGRLSEQDKMRISMNIIDKEIFIYDGPTKFWQLVRFLGGTGRNLITVGKLALSAAGQWFSSDPTVSTLLLRIILVTTAAEIGCDMLCDYADKRVDKAILENLFKCNERDKDKKTFGDHADKLSEEGMVYMQEGRLKRRAAARKWKRLLEGGIAAIPQDDRPTSAPSSSSSSSAPLPLALALDRPSSTPAATSSSSSSLAGAPHSSTSSLFSSRGSQRQSSSLAQVVTTAYTPPSLHLLSPEANDSSSSTAGSRLLSQSAHRGSSSSVVPAIIPPFSLMAHSSTASAQPSAEESEERSSPAIEYAPTDTNSPVDMDDDKERE